eukprot:CAMPEP_0204612918 /NCGR_PEP_ID=MMETSP0717-20131115/963_1 /ASSEMBLY_ACC=CAM_ASM_000666 /TAXON_ID=230516 /ORGANISM="Chaetoceros curvisetus" /LENGTH=208 /DNA_ID=CAMNT_0051625171 /DNA_START=287 /DNA_END=909 /DNA_ORIENTATION=-
MKFPQITLDASFDIYADRGPTVSNSYLGNHHQVSASSTTSIAHASDKENDTSPASSASLRSTNTIVSAKEASSVLSAISYYQHQDLKKNNDEKSISMASAFHTRQNITDPGFITTSSDQWELVGNVLAGDAADDFFGRVAMSKDGMVIAIGANGSDDNGISSGHTKVFQFNQQTELWEQLGQTIVGESEWDRSGISVDMNDRGDTIII